MNLRTIQTDDLQVTKHLDWRDSKGRIRVHVSLKDAPFVCRTFWTRPEELADPKLLEEIKAQLQIILMVKVKFLSRYIVQ